MPIQTAPRLIRAIRSHPGSIVIQVLGPQPELAADALRQARGDIANLDAGWLSAPGLQPGDKNGPTFVSGVTPALPGPVLSIDGGHAPVELLLRIPGIIEEHLERLGVSDAVLTEPAAPRLLKPYEGLSTVPNVAALRIIASPLYVQRGVWTVPPAEWLEAAGRWLDAELPAAELTVTDGQVEFGLPRDVALDYLGAARARRAMAVYVVSGEPPGAVALIQAHFGLGNLSLAVAGEQLCDADLLAVAARLRDLARELAPACTQAFVTFLPTLAYNLDAIPPAPGVYEPLPGGGVSLRSADPSLVLQVADELAFDAYPFQVLGRAHARRLGGPPGGATLLPDGRFELSIGRLEDWLPGSPGLEATRAHGRGALAPCLLSPEAATKVWQRQWDPPSRG
jgi:hypothetical protein